jgi:alcohol dehydrogenase class IV
MLVTDKGIVALGYHNKVISSLKEAGLDYVLFDNVHVDPTTELIYEAIQFIKDENVDGIIGIGGGSSMDTAKAVALVAPNADVPMDDFLNEKPGKNPIMNLILIPTTAGTGSEVTGGAVVIDPKQKAKYGILTRAKMAIVDPELTLGTPASITAACGMDALCHAAESMCMKTASHHTDVLSIDAIKSIVNWLPVACAEPQT